VDLTRRGLLKVGGLVLAAPAGIAASAGRAAAAARPLRTVTLTGVAFGTGTYNYHPFKVPVGVNRLDVRIVKQGNAKTGLGVFDQRGSHYATLERPNGFRGIYGEERGQFFLATDSASQAFTPGPIHPGSWTMVVPVFTAQQPTPYVITVEMSAVPAGRPFAYGRDLHVVLDEPGWYRGDLHAHTPESSDAWSSHSAMTPREWADACRAIGLDFLALTDHNVVTQNAAIATAAGQDMLLMAGEEMTNWFHGHATVSGIKPGDWFDWRQLPADQLTGRIDARTGSIQEFLRAARAAGAFVSAAHPLGATLAWRFFPEAAADPAARTDALEVWTGPFQPDDQASVAAWYAMTRQGQHVVANGGSDLHGVRNTGGVAAGLPTTVVHAQALSKVAVVKALKAGRSFITRRPGGVELYLSATLPGQRQIVGGTVYGAAADQVAVQVRVRRAGGMRLVLLRDGTPVNTLMITTDDETFDLSTPVGTGGFIRTEVRSKPTLVPGNPAASTLDMEALTNPVWIVVGEPPAGQSPDLTQPPTRVGPRRTGGGAARHQAPTRGTPPAPHGHPASGGSASPASTAPPVHAAGQLPQTGPSATLAAAGAAALVGAAVARPMSLTEFRFRAAAELGSPGAVTLTGQVRSSGGRVTLERWVPGCCSSQAPVEVEVIGLVDPRVDQWYDITGQQDGDVLRAKTWEHLTNPPPRQDLEPQD